MFRTILTCALAVTVFTADASRTTNIERFDESLQRLPRNLDMSLAEVSREHVESVLGEEFMTHYFGFLAQNECAPYGGPATGTVLGSYQYLNATYPRQKAEGEGAKGIAGIQPFATYELQSRNPVDWQRLKPLVNRSRIGTRPKPFEEGYHVGLRGITMPGFPHRVFRVRKGMVGHVLGFSAHVAGQDGFCESIRNQQISRGAMYIKYTQGNHEYAEHLDGDLDLARSGDDLHEAIKSIFYHHNRKEEMRRSSGALIAGGLFDLDVADEPLHGFTSLGSLNYRMRLAAWIYDRRDKFDSELDWPDITPDSVPPRRYDHWFNEWGGLKRELHEIND